MSPAVRRALAVGILVLSWPPALASIVIAWAADLPEAPVPGVFLAPGPVEVISRFDELGATIALLYGGLSALLVLVRPHPVTVILAVHAVGSAIACFGVQWGLLAQRVDGLPLAGLLAHAAGWAYVPGTVATTIVPLLVVPAAPRAARRILAPIGIGLAVVTFAFAITNQAPDLPRNPFAIQHAGYQDAVGVSYEALASTGVLLSVVVTAVLVVAWRRAQGGERLRIGWLLLGHAVLTASYAALVLPADAAIPEAVWAFGSVAPALGQVFYPAAVVVMVLGDRIRGIDQTVSNVLTATVLGMLAAAGFLALHATLAAVLPGAGTIALIVAAVVLALQPARPMVRRQVERLVYPDDDAPTELVRRLGERMGDVESGDDGLRALERGLRSAFRLERVRILREPDPSAVDAGEEHLPIAVSDRRVGTLAVTPRTGERLPRRTRRRLQELLGPLAVVIQLAGAADRLEAARAAVVAARHDERRVLRRELHDGIGPALAGIGFGLAAVENLAQRDRTAAVALVDRLRDDLDERIHAVAAVADELDAAPVRDLPTELRALAGTFADAGPEIEVVVASPEPPDLGADRRRAALLVAGEALHNAVRHASADRIRIALRTVGDDVVLEIADDGRGLSAGVGEGVGLTTMRERAAEAGARLDIVAVSGGGTTIRCAFPLRTVQEVPA